MAESLLKATDRHTLYFRLSLIWLALILTASLAIVALF
jgi:hypothetical protein